MGISRDLLWMLSAVVIICGVSSFPSDKSIRSKRSGSNEHEEFWTDKKFMDHLGEYLTSQDKPKVQPNLQKPSTSYSPIKSESVALPQPPVSSINRASRSYHPERSQTSWLSYQYPQQVQHRPYNPPQVATSLQRSPNVSPVQLTPQQRIYTSDTEGSESILIPTVYRAFKSFMGLTTPSPTAAFSSLIIATPYPTNPTEEVVAAPTTTVESSSEPPTQQPPPPPAASFPRISSGSNHKEHKVLVFHLPPDMPIPHALQQIASKNAPNSSTQHVYFQRPPPTSSSPPSPLPPAPKVPFSYIIGESKQSQFSQPQQSVEVPLKTFTSPQSSSGPIVSEIPHPVPIYSNYNPYTSLSTSSIPSFGTVNVQNHAASAPQPQLLQPYIPYIPYQQTIPVYQPQPTPFPIAIPHSHQQQAQFSNPSVLIATAPLALRTSGSQGSSSSSGNSGFLDEENEVDKKRPGQEENPMGNIADWIETGRKIMYFPKGVVDVVDKAVSYAEHNPYVGLVMDTVADKLFGSTKPITGFQEQLAIAQQRIQEQQEAKIV